jgi:hypothetical protein
MVGVAGFEPATPSSRTQWQHEQEVNYFGDFSGLCAPISGHCVPSVLISETPLRNVRAKNGRIYRDLLARPKRFELLTPRFQEEALPGRFSALSPLTTNVGQLACGRCSADVPGSHISFELSNYRA